jgi:hypothetical protein
MAVFYISKKLHKGGLYANLQFAWGMIFVSYRIWIRVMIYVSYIAKEENYEKYIEMMTMKSQNCW